MTTNKPIPCPRCGSTETEIEIDAFYRARSVPSVDACDTHIVLTVEVPIVIRCFAACNGRVAEGYTRSTVRLLHPEEME